MAHLLRQLCNYLSYGITFSNLWKLCLFFINSSDELHMLMVYLLCDSDKWKKNVFHIKVCFQGECECGSFTKSLSVKIIFENILLQVASFIFRSVFHSASAFIISLHTLGTGSLLFLTHTTGSWVETIRATKVHVSSVFLCWRHVCLKSSLKNWSCLQLTCFVRLSHKINPWLVTKEKWSKQRYPVQYHLSSYDSFHCNMILLRKQISEQLLLGLNED